MKAGHIRDALRTIIVGELSLAPPAASLGLPLMHAKERAVIERALTKEMTFLEFGSGGSTVWLADRVRHLHTVEHSRDWVQKLIECVQDNVTVHWREPTFPHKGIDPGKPGQFAEYCRLPSSLAIAFDGCLVDGRARVDCAVAVAPWLKAGEIFSSMIGFPGSATHRG
ncbi:MAG: hypothetical protein WKF37_02660 [Bryobacteraceae bacterium]